MKVLVNEKLSNHKYKTSEGYLICTDAILARTGKQDYLKGELFANCEDTANERISIDRPYNEVFDTKTLSSFENKPVTFDHPDEDVNISNYKSYAVGYVRDVHQGKTENGEDVIMGNLVITDKDAIEAIENGDHTDLSCGYDCEIKDENGSYYQSNIRGNHVALCEEGRAGIARIVDSKINDSDIQDTKVKDEPDTGKIVDTIKEILDDMFEEYLTVRTASEVFERLKKKMPSLKLSQLEGAFDYFYATGQVRRIANRYFKDSKVKDVSWDDIENAIFKQYNGPSHQQVNYSDELEYFDTRTEASKLADWIERKFHLQTDVIRGSGGFKVKVYGVSDSKIKDASLGGVYKDYKGNIYFITSTGSGFSIFNAKGEYAENLHWCRHVSTDGVKMAIQQGQLEKIRDSKDSKKMTIDKAIKLTKLVKSKDARTYKIDWSAVKKDFKEFLDRRSFPYELDSTGTNAIIKVNLKTMSMSSFKKMLSIGVPDEEAINMKTSIDNNSGNTKDLLLTLAYRIGDRVYKMSDDFCSYVKSRYKVGRAKATLTVEDWKPGCFSVEIDMS